MSPRTLLIVLLALVFGGSAAVGVNMMNNRSGGGPTVETVPVVVAIMDIPRGALLTSEVLKIRDFPKDLAPPGTVKSKEDAIGRAVVNQLVKDEPILEGKLADKGAGRGLQALIPKGMRAYTIQSQNTAANVAGFVLPGNRVDILLTISNIVGAGADDVTGGATTTTLLQNIEILAVDQVLEAPAANKIDGATLRTVTLLVTPDQAAKLDLGATKGSLHLTLRSLEDDLPAITRPANLNDIYGLQELPRPKPSEQPEPVVVKDPEPTPPPAPPVEKPEVVLPPPPPPPPPPIVIRTIRGTQEGQIQVFGQTPPPASNP